MILDHFNFFQTDDLADDVLHGNIKITDRPIFLADFDFILFEFLGFVFELLGEFAHLAALMGEKVDLLFAVLDLFFELGVLALFPFDPARYFFNDGVLVADIHFRLMRKIIQVNDALRKTIQKIRIMRDDKDGLIVHD